VPSIRFRLDDVDLDTVEARVTQRYGPTARVISADEVRLGGVGGFFARRALDVVVEVAPLPREVSQEWTAIRGGSLADLLDRADRADTTVAVTPPLSTESSSFSTVLDDLERYTSAEDRPMGATRSRRPVVLLKAPGDLVVIAGLGDDPVTVARSLADEHPGSEVVVGGIARGARKIADYGDAFAARARGLELGRATYLAFGLEPGEARIRAGAATVLSLRPDQVWLAVDASRKPADTARWVMTACGIIPVQALAVLHSDWTTTPASIDALGLPEGWSDAGGIG
jgi:hypothetical protein